jgi:hypothetical protein
LGDKSKRRRSVAHHGRVCQLERPSTAPTYAIQADDVVFRLPARTGIHLRYHSSFATGTVEHTLHQRPLVERLHLLHQLRDIIVTAEEEQQVQANMSPIRSDFMMDNQDQEGVHTPANMQHSSQLLSPSPTPSRTPAVTVTRYDSSCRSCTI